MNNDMVKISVIVPTIGREKLINCVNSIINQSFSPLEIILCYDGDNFEKFIKLLKYNNLYNFVKIINTGPYNGGNNARQSGIDIANGNYIALLDDDDEWLPNHLELMVNKIENINYPYNFVFSKPIRCIGDKEIKPYIYYDNCGLLVYMCTYNKFMRSFGAIQSSLILASYEIFKKIPLDRKLKFHQDTEWLIRIGQQLEREIKIYFTNEYTVKTNETIGSVSKKISSIHSKDLFINTIINKRYLGNLLLGISYNYAVSREKYYNRLEIFFYAVFKAKPDIRLVILAFVKLFIPWQTLRNFFKN